MTTEVSQEAREAEVTQADIDAAQAILDTWFNRSVIETILARHRHQAGENAKKWARIANNAVTRGLNLERELAEARHRQSAERGEVVAWMYERKGPWPARYFHDKRTPAYLDEGEGWIETPLYTLPAAPEAA